MKDYGADPLGDGRFRMVPSGDIVDFEERCRRLPGPNMENRIDTLIGAKTADQVERMQGGKLTHEKSSIQTDFGILRQQETLMANQTDSGQNREHPAKDRWKKEVQHGKDGLTQWLLLLQPALVDYRKKCDYNSSKLGKPSDCQAFECMLF